MPASADFEEAMSIATVGVGVALPAAPAIPYFKGGLATLGKALSVIGIVVFVALLQGDVAKSIPIAKAETRTKEQVKNSLGIEVFHATNFQLFVDAVMEEGVSAIDKSKTSPDSRFGQQFYVASDRITARKEASYSGVLLKFGLSEKANILDLSNSQVASQLGYSAGMARDDVRDLIKDWNLTGIDAIRYPIEKNPGGYNYAIINLVILTPMGVE